MHDAGPCAARSRRAPVGFRSRSAQTRGCHRDSGRFRHLVAERLATIRSPLRPGSGRTRRRRHPQAIGQAGRQRRLRSDHDKIDRFGVGRDRPRRAHRWHESAGRIETLGNSAIPALPGATMTTFDARFGGKFPGEGVFATASADDHDPTRSAVAHAGSPGRLRIGRHARSMVWVRSGPTDTSTIGTPAYVLDGGDIAARVLGQIRSERMSWIGVSQPVECTRRSGSRVTVRRRSTARSRPVDHRARRRCTAGSSVDTRQDVELVEHDAAGAVHGDRIPQRHRVEPTDAPRAAGDRPELVAALGDAGTDRVGQLGRDTGRIRPGSNTPS